MFQIWKTAYLGVYETSGTVYLGDYLYMDQVGAAEAVLLIKM